MGFIEKLLPDTIPLTEEQFKTFLEQTIATEHSRRILGRIDRPERRYSPRTGRGNGGEVTPSPPPKPPIQRRRAAQTGARRRGNRLAPLPSSYSICRPDCVTKTRSLGNTGLTISGCFK